LPREICRRTQSKNPGLAAGVFNSGQRSAQGTTYFAVSSFFMSSFFSFFDFLAFLAFLSALACVLASSFFSAEAAAWANDTELRERVNAVANNSVSSFFIFLNAPCVVIEYTSGRTKAWNTPQVVMSRMRRNCRPE